LIVIQIFEKFPALMEPERRAFGTCTEPVESSPHIPTLFYQPNLT